MIVVRTDIPNAESARARRLSVAANQIQKVDYGPDWVLLKEWGEDDGDIKKLFSESEWKEGVGDVPNFQPVGIDEQGRLDQKKPVVCPECGHEFVPK